MLAPRYAKPSMARNDARIKMPRRTNWRETVSVHARDKRRLFRVLTATLAPAGLAAVLLANAPSDAAQPVDASPKPGTPNMSAKATAGMTPEVHAQVFRGGEAGFVVTEIAYALGPDAEGGACPAGMAAGVRGLVEAYARTPDGQRREGETLQAYERRSALAVNTTADGKNICMHPELAAADPGWRMVSGRNLVVPGIDLDRGGLKAGKQAGDTCAHEQFTGAKGERGIDNQWYRVIGCTTGFQSGGQANSWQIEMYTGSWGILLSLKGVDDVRNDSEVEVGLYANADPIQLSADRKPLAYATYATHPDPRYRATTRGRIVDGVLTIDPVDVRFHSVVNSMTDDRVLRDVRLRLTFTPDGGMEGFLAGYAPIENMYDVQFGARVSRNAKGELAPERLRLSTSVGRAGALGHTCNGAYHALYQAADGHRDPKTGRCTSISTQYRIRVAPAFVVNARTQSVNAPLALR